jgi:prepilin-type N-terminal cleavage/methylation domain-containing protein
VSGADREFPNRPERPWLKSGLSSACVVARLEDQATELSEGPLDLANPHDIISLAWGPVCQHKLRPLKTEMMMPNCFQLNEFTKIALGCKWVDRSSGNSQKGFTLLELLGVVMILSVLTFISVNLYNSFKARSQLSETQDRLKLVSAKIKQYYHTHEQLPSAGGVGANEVPVQSNALDMEQKYRLDGWGQYFRYTGPDATDLTNIAGVGGVAASIESGGPDQNLATVNDNITIQVDVTAEAKEITRNELKVLQEKVAAYDALFAGIDNDGDGVVDDSSGAAAVLRTGALYPNNTCPPTNSFANDPSEGYSTLDAIEMGAGVASYNCSSPLITHIVEFYHLPADNLNDPNDSLALRGNYLKDPWDNTNHNNYYKWGYENRARDDGSAITKLDPRYHRFFSSGPSTTIIEDDIIFTGE